MSADPVIRIEFQELGGPVYSGRAKGELARLKFNLDEIDKKQHRVVVNIPETTYSVTTSFFLAFFSKSIQRAGSREAFLNRYEFHIPEFFRETFDTCISRALKAHHVIIPRDSKSHKI